VTARRPLPAWMPDEMSARILAAYRLRRENWQSVVRRGLLLVAQADGIVDGRGRIVTDRQRQRDARRQP